MNKGRSFSTGMTILVLFVAGFMAFSLSGCREDEADKKVEVKKNLEPYPATAKLPENIKWETNDTAPVFSSSKAKIGGVLKNSMLSYPLTFRSYGPNSNDAFATWNRMSCIYFTLVDQHPDTLEFIPMLATHWSIMEDRKTVYYKLDPDVTFSDGVPATADDYIFGYNMMLSKHLKDPYYNKNFKERYENVEKVDKYTIKVTGAYPSWRALYEFGVPVVPRHATNLDENWVKRDNWKKPVCVGPYVISAEKKGRYVKFTRIENWWGDKKKHLKNRYNFKELYLKVIRDNKSAFRHFMKGELSYFQVNTAKVWAEETDFEAVKKGWVGKRKINLNPPSGKYGIVMNYEDPLMAKKPFRKALQHLMDFQKINKNLMYDAYVRMTSFFGGTQYAKKGLKDYPYDTKKADQYLKKAGFSKRGSDGILVDGNGNRCSFSLTYGGQGLTRHLAVYVEDLKRAGVEMKLRLVDHAKAFNDGLERNYQALLFSRSGGVYPAPEQYLHSDYAKKKQNNNVFAFANAEVDKLIEVYKTNLSFKERLKATQRIDEIVKEEAFYIPFWDAPYIRVLFWNNLSHPEVYEPRYGDHRVNRSETWWFDEEKDKVLKKAMAEKKAIPGVNDVVDVSPYGK